MTEREAIYFGALLHDVGKFWQRAEWQKGRHPNIGGVFIDKMFADDLITFIVKHHHVKELRASEEKGIKKILAEIVCEADSLTSGEREYERAQYQKPYRCITDSIHLPPIIQTTEYYQPISSLTPEKYELPRKTITREDLKEAYLFRWGKFIDESSHCDEKDHETILHFYKKYLWCVPSASYRAVPNVSLYEHSRLTAAVAICMFDYLCNKYGSIANITDGEKIIEGETRYEKRYLLLCGDITGIQQYIYNIAPKGAAKALKGRSFFLQQMLEAIANNILTGFNLPLTNLLYASGGRFYILAPNTPTTTAIIKNAAHTVEQKLLDEYDGELGIAIGDIALCADDFKIGELRISQRWDELSKIVDRKKRNQFSSLLNKKFFEPQGIGGAVISCAATGKDLCSDDNKEIAKLINKGIFPVDSDSDEQQYICKEQKEAQEIGKELRKASVLFTGNDLDDYYSVLGLSKMAVHDTKDIPDELVNKNNVRAYFFNDDNFVTPKASTQRGWKFYGGNWSISEFDEIAKKGKGIHSLGVLRLDVDNLGRIFREGLGEKATFSRIIQLSTMIDFFFSSYLNKLEDMKWDIVKGVCEDGETALGDVMQIIYSGGDDVCIVGVWHVLPDVAQWIHDEFNKFTGNNPNFTLSAGIALFPTKFPLSKAAKLAGEAQDNAKLFKRKISVVDVDKDAICFLGATMSWHDFKHISHLTKELYQRIEVGRTVQEENEEVLRTLDRSILQRLQMIYSEYVNGKREKWAKWRWRACYTLTRFGNSNKAFSKELKDLSAKLFLTTKTEQDFISLLNVPARWTEYLTRKENHYDE